MEREPAHRRWASQGHDQEGAPERSWWQKNLKWLVIGGAGGFAVLVVVAVAVVYYVVGTMTRSGPVEEALQHARSHPGVVEAIGEPLEPGFLITGSLNLDGSSGQADLAIPVSGPRGEGTLYVQAEKKAGRWEMELLEVEVVDRPDRIQVLDAEDIPE